MNALKAPCPDRGWSPQEAEPARLGAPGCLGWHRPRADGPVKNIALRLARVFRNGFFYTLVSPPGNRALWLDNGSLGPLEPILMKCPHCLDTIHAAWTDQGNSANDPDGSYGSIHFMECPACGKIIVKLVNRTGDNVKSERLVLPRAPSRAPLSPDVPPEFGDDYKEACLVLADSAKASAALSRRCLQHLLREKAGVKPSSLDNEIQQTLDSEGAADVSGRGR